MKSRTMGTFVLAASVTLAASACSGDTSSADGSEEAGLTPLKLVVAPIHFEPAYIADREGYFEEEGLDVEIIRGADPTSNIARAVSGEVDITTGSWGTIITSNSRGVPIQAIAGNGYTSADFPTSGILSLADGEIDTPADLDGATVGIQGLNTGSEIAMFLAAEDYGVDPMSIERVEIASSGMETALLEGTVDAVLASNPFYEQIMTNDSVHLVSNPSTEYQAEAPVTIWSATDSWIEENSDTADAFIAAMEKAEDYYSDPANLESILDITAEVSQVDRESLTAEALVPVSVAINSEMASSQIDDFIRFGIVEESEGIDALLWSEAPRK